MRQISKSIEISAPIALVFDLLKPTRLAEWYELNVHFQASQLSGGEFALGSRLRLQSDVATREVEITEFSAPAKLTWRSLDGKNEVSFLLFPIENTTSVQLLESYKLPGLFGPLLDWLFVQRRSVRNAQENLANLKRVAEWEAYQQRQKLRGSIPAVGASPIQLVDGP